MGYTHYWRKPKKYSADAEVRERNYKKVLTDVRKLVKAGNDILANGYGELGTKPQTRNRILFNGIEGPEEDLSHETFHLPNEFHKLRDFEFCKTARKPYDKVVVASLAVLKEHMGDDIIVSSDGDHEEWKEGVDFASDVLGREVPNPL